MTRLIRIRQLREILGHSNATIYRLIKNAGLPAPIKLTSRTSAWDESAITLWISKKTNPAGVASASGTPKNKNTQQDSPKQACDREVGA